MTKSRFLYLRMSHRKTIYFNSNYALELRDEGWMRHKI